MGVADGTRWADGLCLGVAHDRRPASRHRPDHNIVAATPVATAEEPSAARSANVVQVVWRAKHLAGRLACADGQQRPAGGLLGTVHQSTGVVLWDTEDWSEVRTVPVPDSVMNPMIPSLAVPCFSFSRNGRLLSMGGNLFAMAGDEAFLEVWDVQSGTRVHAYDTSSHITDIVFSPDDGTMLVTALRKFPVQDAVVLEYDTSTWNQVAHWIVGTVFLGFGGEMRIAVPRDAWERSQECYGPGESRDSLSSWVFSLLWTMLLPTPLWS